MVEREYARHREGPGNRRARVLDRLRLVDGPGEVVLAFNSCRAIYALAVRLALRWAEVSESEDNAGSRQLS